MGGAIYIFEQHFQTLEAHLILLTGAQQQFDATEDAEHYTWLHLGLSVDNTHIGI